ncbi:S8 family peptidase [Paenibacillus aquistagni]|uniref:S8 family peptidase n=1 Tax=Paenibacillus aquistagni TaxID=1852522 RepID=UPI001483A4A4|nr:S8 family peptidase [Paenibacillus aquistagni]
MAKKVSQLLTAAIRSVPEERKIRKMIVMKDHDSYLECIQQLYDQGYKPIKTIDAAHLLCCHLDAQLLNDSLLQHPAIHHIETDVRVHVHPIGVKNQRMHQVQSSKKKRQQSIRIPWGIRAIHAPAVWPQTRGAGVKVGFIDTGISPHPDLWIQGGVNTIAYGESFEDDNGHGTHIAGTVAALGKQGMLIGVAPDISLYAVKSLDNQGDGYVSDILDGIEWCIRERMHMINMSLGLDAPSRSLRSSIRKAQQQGIIIVSSAGNSGPNSRIIDEPASYPDVIAVAASDQKGRIAPFSSRGRGITITAPGVDILSTSRGGGFGTESGTSMAAPHVTGTIALMLSLKPNLSASDIQQILISSSQRLKGYRNYSQGAGLLNTARAIQDMHTGADKKMPSASSKPIDAFNTPSLALPLRPFVQASKHRKKRHIPKKNKSSIPLLVEPQVKATQAGNRKVNSLKKNTKKP